MGTSQSSPGAPSGAPLIPPWVDAPGSPVPPPLPDHIPLAPPARFGPSRNNLGKFGRSGSPDDMQRGVGHYFGRGLGGANAAAQRFGGTARTAGALYGVLSAVASGRPTEAGSPLDPKLLAGRSANEVMDAVVEATRPIDGTQDAEAERAATKKALSELLNQYPEADLLNLSEPQRLLVIEGFISNDVYNRFMLDVGKAIQANAPSTVTGLARLKEVKDYIRQHVVAEFRKLKDKQQNLDATTIVSIVSQALKDAIHIFEGYVS